MGWVSRPLHDACALYDRLVAARSLVASVRFGGVGAAAPPLGDRASCGHRIASSPARAGRVDGGCGSQCTRRVLCTPVVLQAGDSVAPARAERPVGCLCPRLALGEPWSYCRVLQGWCWCLVWQSGDDRLAGGDGAPIGQVVRFMMRGHRDVGCEHSARCRRAAASVLMARRSVAWATSRSTILGLSCRLLPPCGGLVDGLYRFSRRVLPVPCTAAIR